MSIRDAEKPLPCLSLATVSISFSPSFFSPASHFIFLLSVTLIKYFWGLWCMKDAMWSALDQRCPFGACFALIVLSALCSLLHLFHLSGCWKVAFSLNFFFFQLILVCFITRTLSKKVINNAVLPSWLAEILWLKLFFDKIAGLWVYKTLPRSGAFLQNLWISIYFFHSKSSLKTTNLLWKPKYFLLEVPLFFF